MAQNNEPTSKEITPKERLKIVKKELWEILTSYLKEDETVDASKLKEEYPGLGQPPFQQEKLVEYIKKRHPELKDQHTALRAQVQRVANNFKYPHPAAQAVIRYNPHDSGLHPPHPSRVSKSDIIDRLKDLEEFKRKFENLLTSGRPEPETLSDGKEE